MNRVEVTFRNVSEVIGNKDVGLLILMDKDEKNLLSVPCDRYSMHLFDVYLKGDKATERMLPTVLWEIISYNQPSDFELLFVDVSDGQYLTMLSNTDTLSQYAVHPSDGILLAYLAKLPIYVDAGLWNRQKVPYHPGGNGVAIPVNIISTHMLRDALDKAIKEEDYKLASNLRDELQRRLRLGDESEPQNIRLE